MKWSFTLFFFLFTAGAMFAETPARTIAVPEFQNNSGKVLRINRWDLAAWMANELKKTHRFKPVDRKAVGRAIKDAEWNDLRLTRAGEARLKELPAEFVIYGAIGEWRIATSVVTARTGEGRTPVKGAAGATVVFSFVLVDLSTGEPVKEFMVDGNALGDPDDSSYSDPPYQDDDARFDSLYETASKAALRRAARLLAEKD